MKPEPKQEIKIVAPESWQEHMDIYCASEDARNWILIHAPQFGRMIDFADTQGYISLIVSPLYDAVEVKHYLETQGQEDKHE